MRISPVAMSTRRRMVRSKLPAGLEGSGKVKIIPSFGQGNRVKNRVTTEWMDESVAIL